MSEPATERVPPSFSKPQVEDIVKRRKKDPDVEDCKLLGRDSEGWWVIKTIYKTIED